MLAQLRYLGILEVVRIRSEGFPVRMPYEAFIHRFAPLLQFARVDGTTTVQLLPPSAAARAELILAAGGLRVGGCDAEAALGTSRLFLRNLKLPLLEAAQHTRCCCAAAGCLRRTAALTSRRRPP